MSRTVYKILKIITLIIPTSLLLVIQAIFFNITPDLIINKTVEQTFVKPYDDAYFIYSTTDATFKGGYVIYFEGNFGAVIEEDTIIKMDGKYYQYNGEMFQTVEMVRKAEQQAYRLPLTFFISLFGAFVVGLIIMGKMKIFKTYPKTSVLVTLLTVTLCLYIIDTIVSNLLHVFITATISWAMYCLIDYIEQGKLSETSGAVKESALLSELKKALEK